MLYFCILSASQVNDRIGKNTFTSFLLPKLSLSVRYLSVQVVTFHVCCCCWGLLLLFLHFCTRSQHSFHWGFNLLLSTGSPKAGHRIKLLFLLFIESSIIFVGAVVAVVVAVVIVVVALIEVVVVAGCRWDSIIRYFSCYWCCWCCYVVVVLVVVAVVAVVAVVNVDVVVTVT